MNLLSKKNTITVMKSLDCCNKYWIIKQKIDLRNNLC